MPNLIIETSRGVQQIAAILNVDPPSPAVASSFWQRYGAKRGDISRSEYRPFANQLLSQALRALVDEWLDSGVGADGCERPLRRTVGWKGHSALSWYLDKLPPRIYLNGSGELVMSLDIRTNHPVGMGVLSEATDAEAQRLFLRLIAGDTGGCLCKCRYAPCAKYFVLPKPRANYRSGTFCQPDHQKRAKAMSCMQRRRAAAKRQILELAGEKLRQLKASPRWYGDERMRLRLRDDLRRAAGRSPILQDYSLLGLNWITRHRQEIERSRSKHTG